MMCSVTIGDLRKQMPCPSGWTKLLRYLHKHKMESTTDSVVPLSVILKSNGLEDALWCLCALGRDAVPAMFALVRESVWRYEYSSPTTEDEWKIVNTTIAKVIEGKKLSLRSIAQMRKYDIRHNIFRHLAQMVLLDREDPDYMKHLSYVCMGRVDEALWRQTKEVGGGMARNHQQLAFIKHFCTED